MRLYYYGARYLDPKTSRWASADPAMGSYLPEAPVSDEARKRNGNLPGMGGVFNLVNLAVYHYAGNNPLKYTDPTGRESDDFSSRPYEYFISQNQPDAKSQRPEKSYLQTDLPDGKTACHFWSLVQLAQGEAGFNFSLSEWKEIADQAIADKGMTSDYKILNRDTVLSIAFKAAGLDKKPSWTGSPEGAKGSILKGAYKVPLTLNLAMLDHDYSQTIYHYEAADKEGNNAKDPWGHRLGNYAPFEVEYYVRW